MKVSEMADKRELEENQQNDDVIPGVDLSAGKKRKKRVKLEQMIKKELRSILRDTLM